MNAKQIVDMDRFPSPDRAREFAAMDRRAKRSHPIYAWSRSAQRAYLAVRDGRVVGSPQSDVKRSAP